MAIRRFVGLAAVATCASAPCVAAQSISFPPFLELRVPKPPTVATAEDTSFLVYELHVTNFAPQPMTLKRVEVATATSNGGRSVLFAMSDSALVRGIARPGAGASAPAAERTKLVGGTRAVVYLWVPIDGRTPPPLLQTRVIVEHGPADSLRVGELDAPVVGVTPAGPPIGPPLRGGPWLTANGPERDRGHRRGLIVIGGTPVIAQRFAIDFVKLGGDNRTFSGDQLKNESYHAYGTDALAVDEGTVVAIKDGIPENVPGARSRAVPITLETVGGNYVIIDIGGGRYAFYAHLKPGSLRVRVGDRVRRGQVVGLVGNSGNSTEPHLHFHIADAPSPLGSEGIPNGYESFELLGRCRNVGQACERSAPVVRRGELPLGYRLIRFP